MSGLDPAFAQRLHRRSVIDLEYFELILVRSLCVCRNINIPISEQESLDCLDSLPPRKLKLNGPKSKSTIVVQPQCYGTLCFIVLLQMFYYDKSWRGRKIYLSIAAYILGGGAFEVGIYWACFVSLFSFSTG